MHLLAGSRGLGFGLLGVECPGCDGGALPRRKGAAFAADLAVHGFSRICSSAVIAVDVNAGLGSFVGFGVFHVRIGLEPLDGMLRRVQAGCDGGMTLLARRRRGD